MRKRNFILCTDYYKHTHWMQYPKDTQKVYSYLESRGGMFKETRFLGLQAYLKEYLEGVVIEQWMIDEAEEFLNQGFGQKYFNRTGWQRIVDVHGGKLPVVIKAVKEGSVIPIRNILLSMENTDEQLPFLTQFIETSLLRGVWYPTTVCTLSYKIYQLIEHHAKRSGCEISPFHLNDFGSRGVSSGESAGLAGMAHLVNFMGTDNIEGIMAAQKYYGAGVCGYSVMATEHSTTTVYGKEKEPEAFERFLTSVPSDAIISIVIDSYDTLKAIEVLGTRFKEMILSRTGKVVVRPDSGDPVDMSLAVVKALDKYFGSTTNEKGFKVLNPKVGMIYGDGIEFSSIGMILAMFESNRYATSNIIFGSGGGLIQKVNRDTQKFAIKCSAAKREGKWVDVFKDPITDTGKMSKRGKMALVKEEDSYKTIIEDTLKDKTNLLETVFENGEIKRTQTWEEVKKQR